MVDQQKVYTNRSSDLVDLMVNGDTSELDDANYNDDNDDETNYCAH